MAPRSPAAAAPGTGDDVRDIGQILQYQLFAIGDSPVTVATLATALLVAVVSFILANLAERGTNRFLSRRGIMDTGSVGATGRLVHYVVLAIGLAVAVNTLGINLTALFTAGALFAIALGFAMQNITQNFVSGVILLVERAIKPDDIIEVEGRIVRVTKMGMRATIVRTWDAEDYIIPNSVLVANTVKNLTLRDRVHRIRCQVGVTYDSDMAQVRRVLEEATAAIEWRDPKIDPVILMTEFGNSSVNFDVSVWVTDPWGRNVSRSHLYTAVWFALKEAGIVIAFPQLDLHLDQDALEAMRARGGA
jgi:small-conductance mechanosensitive channel